MKDLSDKSKLSKQPDQTATSSAPKERGRFHRWRWKFKKFMFDHGFESFMPPPPNLHHFTYGSYEIPKEDLEKCPKSVNPKIYKRQLQEKAYEEAMEKWKNGEPYETEEFNVIDDIKFLYRDYEFAKETHDTRGIIGSYIMLALGILVACCAIFGIVIIIRFILVFVPNAPESWKLFDLYK